MNCNPSTCTDYNFNVSTARLINSGITFTVHDTLPVHNSTTEQSFIAE